MQCNVGKVDRAARIVVGLGIIAAGFALNSWWGAVGLIPLITGLAKWCPLYVPLKISTGSCCCSCKGGEKEGEKK